MATWHTSRKKSTVPFSFVDRTNQEMNDYLNFTYPIDLRYNEDLLNRVSERLPNIDKKKIKRVIKTIFRCFRDQLVLGNIINFIKIFEDFKLFFYAHKTKTKLQRRMRIQVVTPDYLRQVDLAELVKTGQNHE
jgi:hypothetical protein